MWEAISQQHTGSPLMGAAAWVFAHGPLAAVAGVLCPQYCLVATYRLTLCRDSFSQTSWVSPHKACLLCVHPDWADSWPLKELCQSCWLYYLTLKKWIMGRWCCFFFSSHLPTQFTLCLALRTLRTLKFQVGRRWRLWFDQSLVAASFVTCISNYSKVKHRNCSRNLSTIEFDPKTKLCV